jgi:hypothetical protein
MVKIIYMQDYKTVAFERYLSAEELIDEINNKYYDLSHIIYQLGGTSKKKMTTEFACK